MVVCPGVSGILASGKFSLKTGTTNQGEKKTFFNTTLERRTFWTHHASHFALNQSCCFMSKKKFQILVHGDIFTEFFFSPHKLSEEEKKRFNISKRTFFWISASKLTFRTNDINKSLGCCGNKRRYRVISIFRHVRKHLIDSFSFFGTRLVSDFQLAV